MSTSGRSRSPPAGRRRVLQVSLGCQSSGRRLSWPRQHHYKTAGVTVASASAGRPGRRPSGRCRGLEMVPLRLLGRKRMYTPILFLVALTSLGFVQKMQIQPQRKYLSRVVFNHSSLEYMADDCLKQSATENCSFDALWNWAQARGISAPSVRASNFSCPSCAAGVRRGLRASASIRKGAPMVSASWHSIISAEHGMDDELREALAAITNL